MYQIFYVYICVCIYIAIFATRFVVAVYKQDHISPILDLQMSRRNVYLYMCVNTYICIYVYTCKYMHMYIYISIYTSMCINIVTPRFAKFEIEHKYVYMHTYTYIYIYSYIYVYINLYISIYIYIYTYISIYIYIHVYEYNHRFSKFESEEALSNNVFFLNWFYFSK